MCRGSWSVVTALSECSPLAQAIKNPAIADEMKCVRFCREMDEIINSLCFLLLSLSHQPFSLSTTGAKPSPG